MKIRPINGYTKAKMKRAIRTRNNGKRARNNEQGMCLYRQRGNGNACAVGCFIPKSVRVTDAMNNSGVAQNLLEDFPDMQKYMPLPVSALIEMQGVHDTHDDESDVRKALCEWIDKNVWGA